MKKRAKRITPQKKKPNLVKHRVNGEQGFVGCCVCTDAEGGVARIRGWLVREPEARRNIFQASVSHADCSDRLLYELLSTAPMPRIQSRWPFLHISQLKLRRNRVAGALPRPAQRSSPPMTLGCLSIQPERSRFFAQSGIEVRGFTPTSVVCLLPAVIMVWMPLKRSGGGGSWWEGSRNSCPQSCRAPTRTTFRNGAQPFYIRPRGVHQN